MRAPILAAVLGLGLAGCLVGDSGSLSTGGGDDSTGPGPDQGSNTGSNNNPTPKLDVSIDKAGLSTELNTTNMVTVSLKASGGFSGAITLAAHGVDTSDVAVPGWMVAIDQSSVTMAADGTATAVVTIKVPSDSAVLAGTVKVDVTSSLGTVTKTADMKVAKQITVNLTTSGGQCVYPASVAGSVKVAQGTKIRWVNSSTQNLTVHLGADEIAGGSQIANLSHQEGASPPGAAYEQTTGSATGTSHWYCHNLNDVKTLLLIAVP